MYQIIPNINQPRDNSGETNTDLIVTMIIKKLAMLLQKHNLLVHCLPVF